MTEKRLLHMYHDQTNIILLTIPYHVGLSINSGCLLQLGQLKKNERIMTGSTISCQHLLPLGDVDNDVVHNFLLVGCKIARNTNFISDDSHLSLMYIHLVGYSYSISLVT